MNLLLVNYEYPPLGGGAGNATAHLARAFVGLGHHVHVLTSGHGPLRGSRNEEGVEVHRLALPRHRLDRSNLMEMAAFVTRACLAAPGMVRRHGIDGSIVFFSLPCGPIGWVTKLCTGRPYVLSLRGGDVPGTEPSLRTLQRILAPARRALMRRSHAVVANSKGLAGMSLHADPIPVAVIPNGVDTGFFSPATVHREASGTVRFLFAGRFQEQKNLFVLLQQFALSATRSGVPLKLTLVGDGPLRDALRSEAERLGVSASVTWRGWLDKPSMVEAYRSADVFINPSLYEGMPNTVMEAMACGLPVIASDVAGNEELVDPGSNGCLYPLAEPSKLGDAIVRMAEDASFRSACSRAARDSMQRSYNWESTALQYIDLFTKESTQ